MEKIVRPFQNIGVTPPTILPYAQATRVLPTVYIRAGQVGATQTFRLTAFDSRTKYVIKYPTEQTT